RRLRRSARGHLTPSQRAERAEKFYVTVMNQGKVRPSPMLVTGDSHWRPMMAAAIKSAVLLVLIGVGLQGCAVGGQAFDPHDLSGFWDITNTGLPAGALNSTSNNRPQMTPWGLEKFRKTKTGVANALSNGASPNEKDWNDPIRWCDPTGFPRIMWSPKPAGMRFAQTNEEVIQFFESDRAWRDI